MSKYYYHAVDSFENFIKILNDGEIKIRKIIGENNRQRDYLI